MSGPLKNTDYVRSLFDDEVFMAATLTGTKAPVHLPLHDNLKIYRSVWHNCPSRVERERRIPKVSQLSLELMKDPDYINFLNSNNNNIVIIQGRVSNNNCSIDIDSEDLLKDFLELNGSIKDTLTTRGSRGVQLWVRTIEDSPPSFFLTDLNDRKKHYGEFRSTGFFTSICGVHPKGFNYKVVNCSKPKKVHFEDIVWPKYLGFSRFYDGGRNYPMELLPLVKSYKDVFRIEKSLLGLNDYTHLAVSYMSENFREELYRYDIYPIELAQAFKASEGKEYLEFERFFEIPSKPFHLWIEPYSKSKGHQKKIKLNNKQIEEKEFSVQERINASWAFC